MGRAPERHRIGTASNRLTDARMPPTSNAVPSAPTTTALTSPDARHDSPGVASSAANVPGSQLGEILVDLDVGSGRTGVPTVVRLLDLARAVAKSPGLRLDGVFFYPGHVTVLPALQAAPLAAVSEKLRAAVDAFDRAGAFRLVDEGSRDAALILSLAPGAYTVQVKSADGSAGSTLIEVYEVR